MTSAINTTSSNESRPQGPQETFNLATYLPIAAVLIVLTNGLVFALFGRTKSLRTPTNIFLLSLAICDFLNGTVNIPLFIAVTLNTSKHRYPDLVLIAVPALQHFTVVLTSYHILAITGERYVAITMPFRRRVFVTVQKVLSSVGGIWVISLVFLITHILLDYFSVDKLVFDLTSMVLVFLLPFITMAYGYGAMFRILLQRKNILTQRQNSREKNRIRSEMRSLIVFVSMLTIFAVCWSPWFILKMLIDKSYDVGDVRIVYIVVRYMSSVVNPILYTLFKNDFRQALKSTTKKVNKRGSCDTKLLTDQRKQQATRSSNV